ncbi:KPN_02809 family neutral zinc metallopeptidase [Schumannella soli]|uniref:Neutral zinc metallopeptidase n=1 Tax=Schumannella soli TaxID=2590779 RepID=A0A506YAR6_9MICO|nr:neutral zinc metallopeptidase [Schumannella soli]TPW77569.1 neutral zinc metallopeptidase [Schumannella soli]
MTFDPNSDISKGRVSKRGRNAGIGVGAGAGGLVIIALLIQAFTGVDLTGLLAGGTGTSGGGATSDESALSCTAQQANDDTECRVQGAAASLREYWPQHVKNATDPKIIIFEGQTNTGCGGATSAVGPFYCPADQQIYLDTSFYDQLKSQFGSTTGPLAQLYVIGHEWGHHIQHITGITDGKDLRATGPSSDSVRLELQADCFAGAWLGAAAQGDDRVLEPPTRQQIDDALNAAATVGDDNIQEKTQGQATPESWTHGSSAARQKWFLTGYNGDPQSCNTFDVSAAQLGDS